MQAFGEYSNDNTASTIKARDYKDATDLVASSVVGALCARDFKGVGNQYVNEGKCISVAIPIHDQATRHAGKRGDKQDGKGNGLGVGKEGDPCPTLTKGDKHAVLYENHPNDSRVTGPLDVAPSCVSRYGTGGGNVPLVQEKLVGQVDWRTAHSDNGEVSQTLKTDLAHQSGPCLAVDAYNQSTSDISQSISSSASDINHTGGVLDSRVRSAVRRLLPMECERLQGFPDDHTLIPWRGKPASECPDGPRYKALGNSMAVPCMRWIGTRIHNYTKKEVS
jgi:DNA (cytosine-5)-methyltransferase 1